ncbi:hypothetical protein M231_04165 [Tremella mesenterica]|uniref:Uncharacterized protein n=1 Tax=Tremella mesenterica TaxID=5217 RepID=A0A4Q1BL76_TREME|nr:hypothetical protein M231_04165 [Tremella mesenterica]
MESHTGQTHDQLYAWAIANLRQYPSRRPFKQYTENLAAQNLQRLHLSPDQHLQLLADLEDPLIAFRQDAERIVPQHMRDKVWQAPPQVSREAKELVVKGFKLWKSIEEMDLERKVLESPVVPPQLSPFRPFSPFLTMTSVKATPAPNPSRPRPVPTTMKQIIRDGPYRCVYPLTITPFPIERVDENEVLGLRMTISPDVREEVVNLKRRWTEQMKKEVMRPKEELHKRSMWDVWARDDDMAVKASIHRPISPPLFPFGSVLHNQKKGPTNYTALLKSVKLDIVPIDPTHVASGDVIPRPTSVLQHSGMIDMRDDPLSLSLLDSFDCPPFEPLTPTTKASRPSDRSTRGGPHDEFIVSHDQHIRQRLEIQAERWLGHRTEQLLQSFWPNSSIHLSHESSWNGSRHSNYPIFDSLSARKSEPGPSTCDMKADGEPLFYPASSSSGTHWFDTIPVEPPTPQAPEITDPPERSSPSSDLRWRSRPSNKTSRYFPSTNAPDIVLQPISTLLVPRSKTTRPERHDTTIPLVPPLRTSSNDSTLVSQIKDASMGIVTTATTRYKRSRTEELVSREQHRRLDQHSFRPETEEILADGYNTGEPSEARLLTTSRTVTLDHSPSRHPPISRSKSAVTSQLQTPPISLNQSQRLRSADGRKMKAVHVVKEVQRDESDDSLRQLVMTCDSKAQRGRMRIEMDDPCSDLLTLSDHLTLIGRPDLVELPRRSPSPKVQPTQVSSSLNVKSRAWKRDPSLRNPAWYEKAVTHLQILNHPLKVLANIEMFTHRPLTRALKSSQFQLIERDGPIQGADLILSPMTAILFRKLSNIDKDLRGLINNINTCILMYRRVIVIFEVIPYSYSHSQTNDPDEDIPDPLTACVKNTLPQLRRRLAVLEMEDYVIGKPDLVFVDGGVGQVINLLSHLVEEDNERFEGEEMGDRSWLENDSDEEETILVEEYGINTYAALYILHRLGSSKAFLRMDESNRLEEFGNVLGLKVLERIDIIVQSRHGVQTGDSTPTVVK